MISDARYNQLLEDRYRRPELVAQLAEDRARGDAPRQRRRMLVLAADHPARSALHVGDRRMAMRDRRDLLTRIVRGLSVPGVDGFLGTADLIEDLLLLGALESKVVFGSMNRSGLAGSTWELDDRFTGYDAPTIDRMGLDGGKMLLRLDYQDPGTNRTIEACAQAVSALADRKLLAMIEPLPATRKGDQVEIVKDVDALIRSVSVASGLGATSAYTWLKLPPSAAIDDVMAATTLPALLLGGDPAGRWDEVVDGWQTAMAVPNIRGLVAGRGLLYPADDDVEAAVALAASIVHGTETLPRPLPHDRHADAASTPLD